MTITEIPNRRQERPAPPALATPAEPARITPVALLDMLENYVADREGHLPLAPHDLRERTCALLEHTDDFEIWAIHWPKDLGLELHDHGGSYGALWVVDGALHE